MQTRRSLSGLPRAALALAAGAVAGAALVTLAALLGQVVAYGPGYVTANGLNTGSTVFLWALAAWAGGLIVFAALPWWGLHRLGRRGWSSAVLLGAALTFAAYLGLSTAAFGLMSGSQATVAATGGGPLVVEGRLTPQGWRSAISGALLLSAAGATVGLVIWRVAYRGPGALDAQKARAE
ncbi:MAG: hypothetical protein ABIO39_07850 [Caulobacteraceae bacterium]